MSHCYVDDFDKVCYLWFLQQCAKGTPVSGPIIHEKALQLLLCCTQRACKLSRQVLDGFRSIVGFMQCWASYFVKVTSYILLATELFSYNYILPIK